MPVAMYLYFETTAPTNNCFDLEKKMFVQSYILIAAFHLHLKLRKIIVQRSYGHSLEQLATIDYSIVNCQLIDQMSFIDITQLNS